MIKLIKTWLNNRKQQHSAALREALRQEHTDSIIWRL